MLALLLLATLEAQKAPEQEVLLAKALAKAPQALQALQALQQEGYQRLDLMGVEFLQVEAWHQFAIQQVGPRQDANHARCFA